MGDDSRMRGDDSNRRFHAFPLTSMRFHALIHMLPHEGDDSNRRFHIRSRIWMHMAASSTPMFPPPFSARPIRAPSTWRPFASPRS